MAEQTFESKFAKMAGIQLNEKLPSLLPYNVGFQLLEKDDEGTRAIGIHAFVVNGLWVYVPVFFLNGQLKGMDIMYLKQRDLFVPALDNWISTLKQQSSQLASLGGPGRPARGANTPDDVNLDELEFGSIGKTASLNDIITDAEKQKMLNLAEADWKLDLFGQLQTMPKEAAEIFVNTLTQSPDFANAVLRHYTPNELGTLSALLQKSAEVLSPEQPKLAFITDLTSKEAAELPEKAKSQLLRNGLYIQDERPEHSLLFRDKLAAEQIQTISENGVYDIVMKDGETKPFLVVALEDETDRRLMISFSDPKQYLSVYSAPLSGTGVKHRGTMFCELLGSPVSNLDQFEELRGKLGETPSKRKFIDNGNQTAYHRGAALIQLCNKRGGSFRVLEIARFHKDGKVSIGSHNALEPIFTKADGRLAIHGDTVLIPENTRMFTRMDFENGDHLQAQFATQNSIINRMGKQAGLEKLMIARTGENSRRVFVDTTAGRTQAMDKLAAARHLTEEHGVEGGQAMQLIKEALRDGKGSYLIKYAAAARIPHRTEYGAQESTRRVNSKSLLPAEAIRMASESAASGNKQVFDVAVLQSLVEAADIGDLKKEFMTDMISGMDRCGRLLLMFYWHNDNFADRYGKENLQSIEDKIKQVFKTTGDLILFLKDKASEYGDLPENLIGTLSEELGDL